MRCNTSAKHPADNRVVVSSKAATVTMLAIVCLTGCIWTIDDDPHYSGGHHHYDFDPELLEVGWDCYDSGVFDKWTIWARAYDEDGYEDLNYLDIRVYSLLVDSPDVIEIRQSDHVSGYFEVEREYYSIQCDEPVDIEFIIVDNNNNWDQYLLYW